MRSIFIIIIVVLGLTCCTESKKLKLAIPMKGTAAYKVGLELSEYLNSLGWEIQLVEGTEYFGSKALTAIVDKDIDIAFIQNDQAHTRESNDIRTILPLYPNINYIFYRSHLKPDNLHDLLINNSVLLSYDDEVFYKSLFDYYGVNIDSVDLTLVEMVDTVEDFIDMVNNGKYDVLCVFAAIHNPYIKEMLENNWEIFSLGDISYSNRGSSVEGFCMNYPRTKPFIVPRNFFGQKPSIPIYTVVLDELLVTHEKTDKTLIYDFVNDIYEGRHYLSQSEKLFIHITEDFDQDALNFPLHDGTVNYLKRDQPSFLERYAEAIGVIFSVLVVLYGGFTSIKKIRKERIDKYYKKVMLCDNLAELKKLSNEAVNQLQNEKLTADESFTIFLSLVEKRRQEIENNPIIK